MIKISKFAALAAILLFWNNTAPAATTHLVCTGTARIAINGMVCDFCARTLETLFRKQETIETVTIDLKTAELVLKFNQNQSLDYHTITQLVADAGYEASAANAGCR